LEDATERWWRGAAPDWIEAAQAACSARRAQTQSAAAAARACWPLPPFSWRIRRRRRRQLKARLKRGWENLSLNNLFFLHTSFDVAKAILFGQDYGAPLD